MKEKEMIGIDIWDFVMHQKEIQEQIKCEFSNVSLAIRIPSIADRIKEQQKEMKKVVDLSKIKIKVNGKAIK